MEQLKIFGQAKDKNKKESDGPDSSSTYWKIFIDGASRNNPGPAGAGFYVLKDSKFFAKHGYYLGIKTNNQAEYLALLLGVLFLQSRVKSSDHVHIVSDSQLLVRQLKGEYKVKATELKPLFQLAQKIVQELQAELFHVLRIDNKHADAMANRGIDTKQQIPDDIKTVFEQHGISV